MNLFTFVSFCAFLSTATSQYYYVSQPAVYHHFQQPTTYNAFSPFSTYHVNPHYQQFSSLPAPHSHFQQFRTVPAPQPPPAPVPVHRTALAQSDDMDYRGFAYHTRTDNGATSHVLFVTGPQAQQVNSRVFNNFNTRAFGHNNEVNHARTVASEMFDPVQKQEEKQNVLPKNIQDVYTPSAMQKVENNDPYQVFQSFFQNTQGPASRLINFYSRNTDLFAQQAPGYPANVVPLPYNTNNVDIRILQTQQNNTESNNDNDDKKSDIEVAAESIITNTQFRLNDIGDQFESKKTQSTSTTVPSLPSTTLETLPSTLHDMPESSSISASESSTSTFEEVTEALSTSSASLVEDVNFLIQRFGNLDTESVDSTEDMPGSESSESATLENVTMSANLTAEALTTSDPITSSSETSIPTTEETNKNDKITTTNTISDTTTDQVSLSTNESVNPSEELTTLRAAFESDEESTTNSLAEIVEEESKTTESSTEENSNENISTTENMSITTDAMSTTSQ